MAPIKEALEAVNGKRAAAAALLYAALIGPPFLAVYRFKPDAFTDWDLSRLLLFCAALSVPSILLGILTMMLVDDDIPRDKDFNWAILGGLYFAAASQTLAHLSFLFTKRSTLREYVYAAAVAGLMFAGYGLLIRLWTAWRRRRLPEPCPQL